MSRRARVTRDRADGGELRPARRNDLARAAPYLLPPLAMFAVFVVYPVASTAYYSLLKWNGLSAPTFVGFDNYVGLTTDPVARQAILNACILLTFYSFIPICLGLALAACLARLARKWLLSPLRALLFLPVVIAPVVVAVGWRLILDPNDGLLNRGLAFVGLQSLQRAWLGDFDLALPSVGVVATWATFGLTLVLFLAGLQRISPSLYEAARLDGAGPIREFRSITIPGLVPEIVVAFVVTTISAFRNFDLVYNLTRGGPGNATNVPVLEIYRRAFLDGEVGSASALGILIAVIVLVLTIGVLTASRRYT